MTSDALTVRKMSAADVFAAIASREPLFILDVRNEDAYADWRIEGPSIASQNTPYFEFLEGIDPVAGQLPPKNDAVLVVCAKEGSSQFVADLLVEAGWARVAVLAGGMRSWSEHLHPVHVSALPSGGAVYQFLRPGKGCLSYMVVCGDEAVVVDAARTFQVYLDFAEAHGWHIRNVIDTHLHADHVSGGRMLAQACGASYWLSPQDASDVHFDFEPLVDGHGIALGGVPSLIQVVHSPGHTIGSASLIVDHACLLSGDTLFVHSIGRPDLAGQAQSLGAELRRSLYTTYKSLGSDLLVLPAHFAEMSEINDRGFVGARLGDLYRNNAGLNVPEESHFLRMVTENLPQQPHAYQDIRLTNMGQLTPEPDQLSEMEIGPNRCAVHG